MRRPIKRMLWVATLLTGAFSAAVVISPFWLRPLIQHQASAILVRPISTGSLRESLNSVAPLIVDFDNRDVVVGNPPGFPAAAEPFARLARMRVSLDVLSSLRRGEFVTLLVDLQRPVITAASTADGEKNYVFPSRHAQADELRITDGHMHVTLAGLHADLQGDFATQAISSPDGKPQIAIMAKGTYADLQATLRIICDAALRSDNDAPPSAFTIQITDGQTKIHDRPFGVERKDLANCRIRSHARTGICDGEGRVDPVESEQIARMRYLHEVCEAAIDADANAPLLRTEIVLLGRTSVATAAADPRIDDALITDRDAGGVRSELHDAADNLVARGCGKDQSAVLHRRHLAAAEVVTAMPEMQVGMTDGAACDRQNNVAAFWLRIRQLTHSSGAPCATTAQAFTSFSVMNAAFVGCRRQLEMTPGTQSRIDTPGV